MTAFYTLYGVLSVLAIPFFAVTIYRTGDVDKILSIFFAVPLCMAWPVLLVVGMVEVCTYLYERAPRW